ncbi:MAG: hypothetical protein UY72_C0016G0006 [Candidatus Uhrbacteria bacterium GW2011_GWD2_52_7]|uniref:Uncharacterized protein n=1 Tax=Candidatus Uhrbacteria bacterium GW2011_GWD2_52_7 TaxID=1618989 RepID=A0A0G1XGA7_9BACT|nr:MAG: hypothetical protein UY72_C0016G0006 [Candidatus Uhrbacteria bacterium GW2011_GWD2_52_7]
MAVDELLVPGGHRVDALQVEATERDGERGEARDRARDLAVEPVLPRELGRVLVQAVREAIHALHVGEVREDVLEDLLVALETLGGAELDALHVGVPPLDRLGDVTGGVPHAVARALELVADDLLLVLRTPGERRELVLPATVAPGLEFDAQTGEEEDAAAENEQGEIVLMPGEDLRDGGEQAAQKR